MKQKEREKAYEEEGHVPEVTSVLTHNYHKDLPVHTTWASSGSLTIEDVDPPEGHGVCLPFLPHTSAVVLVLALALAVGLDRP